MAGTRFWRLETQGFGARGRGDYTPGDCHRAFIAHGRRAPAAAYIGEASINVQPPGDENIATSGDVGATLSKERARSVDVKVVSSKEQPIELCAGSAE